MLRFAVYCFEADSYVSGFSPPGISFVGDPTRAILFYAIEGAEGLISALSDLYDTDFEVCSLYI